MNSDTEKNERPIPDAEIRNSLGEVVKPEEQHQALLRDTLATSPGSVTSDVWQEWYEDTSWNKWREANPEIRPDLSGAKLAGMVLRVGDFSNVDFSYTDLSGSSLGELSNADLTECNLEEADLIGALIDGCYFFDANLHAADLSDSSAGFASFGGANLREANLCESEMNNVKFGGADLRGAHFGGAPLAARISKIQICKIRMPVMETLMRRRKHR